MPSVPKHGIRPTPARVKESLFAIIGTRIEDATVLDLFAGTGALGFEALSRGARWATFVDSDAHAVAKLRATARELGVEAQCEAIASAAERIPSRLRHAYDVVFADPPYARGFPGKALDGLRERGLLAPGAVVVFEHSARAAVPTPGFVPFREERYGDVAISFIEAEVSPEQP